MRNIFDYIGYVFIMLRQPHGFGFGYILMENMADPGASYWEHRYLDDPCEYLSQREEFDSYSCHYRNY